MDRPSVPSDEQNNSENPDDPENPQGPDEPQGPAESLTLLFTNDFHSQICPIDASSTYNADCGGISRIKVLVDSVRAADRNFQAQIDYYTNLLEESMNEVLAYCPNTMRKGTPEALLSNFTADAVYDICTEYFGEEPDLAIYNNGGIRAEMPAGDVTRGTVYSIYPFDNTLTLIEIKGSDLLEAFNGIATYGGEPVSSSVKLTIKDKSVYSLEIGGEPVQNDRTYKVATINYLIDATNYLSALRNYTSRRESGVYIYELMSDYVKSLGDQGIQLSSQLDGRVTVI